MAKVGGRSAWIAWPAAIMCAGVIGALLVLAVPGVPAAIDFIGSTLRAATSAPSAGDAGGSADKPATDCRDLYPDRLWAELTWTPDALLSQTAAAPATAANLATALAPEVRFTCTWNTEDGRSIVTTIASVSEAASAVAQAALSADGFSCGSQGEIVHCERSRDSVSEMHDIRGETWVASILTGWVPEDYSAQVASRAFTD